MNLAELSLKRPVTITMFFLSMMVIGLIAAVRLPLEKFPDIEFPFLFVDVPYPGSTPAEVERVLARPIEEALSTVPGIQRMRSTSRADGVQIFIEFKWGNSVAVKAVEAREKLDGIRKDLPSDLQRYQVLKFFPAEAAGGPRALRAFATVFPEVRFCPTGGVTAENARSYLELPNVVCVGGSWLAPPVAIADRKWHDIQHFASQAVGAFRSL